MNDITRGILAVFITMLGWSSAGIFIKLLPSFDALFIVSIRLTVSLMVVLPIVLLSNKIKMQELKNFRTWMFGVIIFFCYVFGTFAFQMAPVAEVTIFMTISPVFVILFRFLFGEVPKKFEVLGVSFAILGVVFITFEQLSLEDAMDIDRFIGDLCALILSILLAVYTMWYQDLKDKHKAPNTLAIAISTFMIGFILFIFLAIKENFSIQNLQLDYMSIWYLFGVSILSTAIPTMSYTIVSKYLHPLLTTSILLLQPFIAIFLAVVFIHEIPSLWVIPGLAFIVFGLSMILKTK